MQPDALLPRPPSCVDAADAQSTPASPAATAASSPALNFLIFEAHLSRRRNLHTAFATPSAEARGGLSAAAEVSYLMGPAPRGASGLVLPAPPPPPRTLDPSLRSGRKPPPQTTKLVDGPPLGLLPLHGDRDDAPLGPDVNRGPWLLVLVVERDLGTESLLLILKSRRLSPRSDAMMSLPLSPPPPSRNSDVGGVVGGDQGCLSPPPPRCPPRGPLSFAWAEPPGRRAVAILHHCLDPGLLHATKMFLLFFWTFGK